jgi:hypothetical protein
MEKKARTAFGPKVLAVTENAYAAVLSGQQQIVRIEGGRLFRDRFFVNYGAVKIRNCYAAVVASPR